MSLAAIVGCSDECRDLGGGHRACGARMAEVPIIGSDGAFIVAGRVNGRQAELLVDTGADTTVISSQFLAVADQSSRWLDELCLGDYCLAREAIFAWETPFSSMVAGAPQGFVGMSTLAHLSVSFAFGKQLTIGDGGDGCSGHSVALTLSEVGTPLAAIRLDGSDFGDMTIDTGAARSVLAQATVDRLGGYLKDQAVPTSSCTVFGCSDNSAYLGRVQELCVGDVCARDVEVKFPAWDAVGANWLAGHNVRFDFRQRAVIFCDL
jgi:predicted aspartyl protease